MDITNSELTGIGSCVMVILNCGIPFTLLDEDFQDIDVPKCNVQIVISNGEREDLLELLTSAFEVPMNEYIALLQSNLCIESMSPVKRLSIPKDRVRCPSKKTSTVFKATTRTGDCFSVHDRPP